MKGKFTSFIKNANIFMITRDLLVSPTKIKLPLIVTSVSCSVFNLTKQELMGSYPSRVKRTRIRVIGVNFSDFLIKGKEF